MVKLCTCGLLFCFLAFFTACEGKKTSPIMVFAAASLRECLQEIQNVYAQNHPEKKIQFQFAGSQTLAMQIRFGAPADIFFSADQQLADELFQSELSVKPIPIITNQLVLISHKASQPSILSLKDLTQKNIKLVLGQPSSPIGKYSLELFQRDKLWDLVQKNVASFEENVKNVLNKVALGEADAGIVYVTDLTQEVEPKLNIISLPAASQPRAVYTLSLITNEYSVQQGAKDFAAFLQSPTAKTIFKKRGFQLP